MNGGKLLELPWLLPAPQDLAARVNDAGNVADLLDLTRYALNINQCEKLNKALLRQSALSDLPVHFNLGVVSNSTTDFLPAVLRVAAARLGIALELHCADYDQVMQVALGSAKPFAGAELDAILVALDEHYFPMGDMADAPEILQRSQQIFQQVALGLEQQYQVPLIIQSVADRGEPLLGSLDLRQAGTRRNTLYALNDFIANTLCGNANVLFDVAALAETIGLANWSDPVQYYMAKLPCNQNVLPFYSARLANLIAAMKGRSRKCLVFDLDNTVWGGVIGDDGLDGIAIGQGSLVGEAYLGVQRCILDLHQRGIVLAVSSKNTHQIAIAAFEQHEDMLLKTEHISVFQANWEDKASNINAIAKSLNLGLDAMVFLDDNPVERQRVRDTLPEVAVPELPEDPAYYPRVLTTAGYFESIAFSEEDQQRNANYRANAQRIEAFESLGSLEEYLTSLQMVLHLRPFDERGLARIVQLINKTNQFNLTTHRHDQNAVHEMMKNPDTLTLQARLTDAYSDNGMIGVIIGKRSGDELAIDTFLMSCRVLERRVEHSLMNQFVAMAKRQGVNRISASYIPTERNAIVAELYPALGFSSLEGSVETGATHWYLDVDSYSEHDVFTQVEK